MTEPIDQGEYFGRPADHLRRTVIRYRGHRMAGPRPPRVTLPSATVTLLLGWGQPLTIRGGPDGEASSSHWPAMVAGLRTSAMLAGFHGSGTAIEVELTPLGARRLLGLPLHHLANAVVDPDEILGADWTAEATEALAAAPMWSRRWQILDSLITRRLTGAAPASPAAAEAWTLLGERGGAVSLRDLTDATGLGARRVQGLLREHVGLPAQTLSRILRFHRTLALASNGRQPLAGLAASGGYHDQAHMTRDFRVLSGHTPRELLGIMRGRPTRHGTGRAQPFNDFGMRRAAGPGA